MKRNTELKWNCLAKKAANIANKSIFWKEKSKYVYMYSNYNPAFCYWIIFSVLNSVRNGGDTSSEAHFKNSKPVEVRNYNLELFNFF